MRLKVRVYRIANRFPNPERETWCGKPWAWDMWDRDAPIRRLDGHPTLVDWGYADSWYEAIAVVLRVLREAAGPKPHSALGSHGVSGA